MELFGLAFIMYFFKLSYGSGFWRNLRNDNNILYKQATKIERLPKKLKKYELDLKFLISCRDLGVYPKFTRWKNVKHNKKSVRTTFYRRVLLDEITSKHRAVKSTRRELNNGKKILFSSTTFFKGIALRFSINQSVEKEDLKIVDRHKHKLENFVTRKEFGGWSHRKS